MKILITSGGCKVPIDEVRHIGNFSSGRYGKELVTHFMDSKGENEIIHFYEKGSRKHEGWDWTPTQIEYVDYYDYLKVKDLIKDWQPDIIISAAAISDYILDKTEGKISSDQDELTIKLKKGEKVIQSFRELAPNAFIVGFKLLVSPTPEEITSTVSKQMKCVDMVVFNDLTKIKAGDSTRFAFIENKGTYQKYNIDYNAVKVKTASELKDHIMEVSSIYTAHKLLKL